MQRLFSHLQRCSPANPFGALVGKEGFFFLVEKFRMRDTKDGELKDPEWTESEVGEVRGSSGDGGGEMGGGLQKTKKETNAKLCSNCSI